MKKFIETILNEKMTDDKRRSLTHPLIKCYWDNEMSAEAKKEYGNIGEFSHLEFRSWFNFCDDVIETVRKEIKRGTDPNNISIIAYFEDWERYRNDEIEFNEIGKTWLATMREGIDQFSIPAPPVNATNPETIAQSVRKVIERSEQLEPVKKVSSKKYCEWEDNIHGSRTLYGKCFIRLDSKFIPYAIHPYKPDEWPLDELDLFFTDGEYVMQDVIESFVSGKYIDRVIDITSIAREYYWNNLDLEGFIHAVTKYIIDAVESQL